MHSVEIVEVSPRDGIQNEAKLLTTDAKLALVEKAVAAGVRRIEVTSFVNPARVPQMFDSDALAAALPRSEGVVHIGLVLNRKGFERARAASVDEINMVVVASDTFNRRNQGVGTFETIAAWRDIAEAARGTMPAGVTIGAAFGCPYEGEIPLDRLLAIVEAVARGDPREIALADTIGAAGPRDIATRVGAVRARFPEIPLRCHFHNTRNTGYANAWAAIEAGVATLDSSFGGAGGCPFAPRATGNIATEDLVYMLHRSGVATGLDLVRCIEAAQWLETALEIPLPGQLMKAGGFPPA